MGLFDKLKFWKKEDIGINFHQPPLGIDTPNFSSNMMPNEMQQMNREGDSLQFDADAGHMDSLTTPQNKREGYDQNFSEPNYGHNDSSFEQQTQNMNMQRQSISGNFGSGYGSGQEEQGFSQQNPDLGGYREQHQASREKLVSHFDEGYNVKNQNQPQQQNMQSQSARDYALEKNIELISVKLDSLKIAIESISHRLSNIERVAYQQDQQEKTRRPGW